ncbi:hypothetical protein ACFFQF_09895 [Haladaptatus pallidirubidus]|uniref:Uncharacterized protein n=1 Tax=Haladaptatus pallidirubidus TaxID=1008152 RepID=A0AAV3UFE1_9EURY|nr:hypothetical protein [Haladaptatus pallidirubidus]
MKTTNALLLGILLVLFGGVASLGNELVPYEWAVITLWVGLAVGVGGVVFNEFVQSES